MQVNYLLQALVNHACMIFFKYFPPKIWHCVRDTPTNTYAILPVAKTSVHPFHSENWHRCFVHHDWLTDWMSLSLALALVLIQNLVAVLGCGQSRKENAYICIMASSDQWAQLTLYYKCSNWLSALFNLITYVKNRPLIPPTPFLLW